MIKGKTDLIGTTETANLLGIDRRTILRWIEIEKLNPEYTKESVDGRIWYLFNRSDIEKIAKNSNIVKRIKKEHLSVAREKQYGLNQEEYNIINKWNDSVKDLSNTRNRLVEYKQYPKVKSHIRRILRTSSITIILEQIEIYIAICKANKHIINDKDYSYTSLAKFLNRIQSDIINNKEHWWIRVSKESKPIKDQHPNLTKYIADKFAANFLGKKEYMLDNPSRDYIHFYVIAERISYILKHYSKTELCPEDRPLSYIIKLIFDCASEQYAGKTVYPGTIARDNFWTMEFAQFLRREISVIIDWSNWGKKIKLSQTPKTGGQITP